MKDWRSAVEHWLNDSPGPKKPLGIICNECGGNISTGSCDCGPSSLDNHYNSLGHQTMKSPNYDECLDPGTNYSWDL